MKCHMQITFPFSSALLLFYSFPHCHFFLFTLFFPLLIWFWFHPSPSFFNLNDLRCPNSLPLFHHFSFLFLTFSIFPPILLSNVLLCNSYLPPLSTILFSQSVPFLYHLFSLHPMPPTLLLLPPLLLLLSPCPPSIPCLSSHPCSSSQVTALQEEKGSLLAENQLLMERLNHSDSIEDINSPAGRRHLQLQTQLEQLQEETFRWDLVSQVRL